MNGSTKHVHSFIGGGIAGTIATVVTYPFDLLRTRFAIQGKTLVYKTYASAVKQIMHTDGFRGFYVGSTTAAIQVFPYMGLVFGMNALFKDRLFNYMAPSWRDATAGFAAGVVAKMAVYPLDTLRKRYQVHGSALHTHKGVQGKNIIEALTYIYQNEGFRGFYRGSTLAILKAAPSTAITLWTFEQTLILLNRFL